MRAPIRWLQDYVDIDLPPGEIAERLTMAGLEVDAVEPKRPDFSDVVVARVLSVKPHPGADKLSVCEVRAGGAVYPVVCGAPNVRAGMLSAFAKVGAVIPGGYTIKSTKIRGEASEGMLCSEEELGIGEDAAGIMDIGEDLPEGADLAEALGLVDTVLDIGITPNRSDCLSVIGIAREVAFLTGKTLRYPAVDPKEGGGNIGGVTSVRILDPDLCPRYTARMIRNVKIGPSPAWMRRRLEAAGMRAINNVVDVTNFVMLEFGQPLHAFDFRFLEEGRIEVRRSRKGEPFVSLDGKERTLGGDVLMICDGKKPVAIGGIMGGLNSEVKDDTSDILLESAYFNPSSIRRSARSLGMGTDAAYRFERGIDPEGVVRAANRAAQLIAELSGGTILRGIIDEHPKPVAAAGAISLRAERVNAVLGTSIPEPEMVRILEGIEMKVEKAGAGRYSVRPPSFRVDIEREIDLVEEIARLWGFGRVPVTMPCAAPEPPVQSGKGVVEGRIRDFLSGSGYTEVINYSFITPLSADRLGLPERDERRGWVKIANPLSEDQSVLRTTILWSLVETWRRNAYAGCSDLKIYEIGKVFFRRGEGELPLERNRVGGLITGARYDESWGFGGVEADFFDLKGVVEGLFDVLRFSGAEYRSDFREPFLHPGRCCGVSLGGETVGFVGEIHPDVQAALDMKARAVVFELDLDALTERFSDRVAFREIPRYPSGSRDTAFLVDRTVEAERMLRIVREGGEELLESVDIFDVYTGRGVEEGKKSVAVRFSYRSSGRTLTDEEIRTVHERIVSAIVRETGARIRGTE